MKKFIVTGAVALITLSSVPAFAQSANIPSLGQVSGGSEVDNSKITIKGNQAKDVTNGGGTLDVMKVGSVNMAAETNVNSVVLMGSKIKNNSSIDIIENKAEKLMNIGGSLNVNSVVLK